MFMVLSLSVFSLTLLSFFRPFLEWFWSILRSFGSFSYILLIRNISFWWVALTCLLVGESDPFFLSVIFLFGFVIDELALLFGYSRFGRLGRIFYSYSLFRGLPPFFHWRCNFHCCIYIWRIYKGGMIFLRLVFLIAEVFKSFV